jgi:hypothetical protein
MIKIYYRGIILNHSLLMLRIFFFLSFFLSLTAVRLVIVGVEDYCCIWSYWMIYTHTHTNTRWDSSGRVIGLSQRPLCDNTQHSQQTDFRAPVRFEPAISANERPQTHALDRMATEIVFLKYVCKKNCSIMFYVYIYIYMLITVILSLKVT